MSRRRTKREPPTIDRDSLEFVHASLADLLGLDLEQLTALWDALRLAGKVRFDAKHIGDWLAEGLQEEALRRGVGRMAPTKRVRRHVPARRAVERPRWQAQEEIEKRLALEVREEVDRPDPEMLEAIRAQGYVAFDPRTTEPNNPYVPRTQEDGAEVPEATQAYARIYMEGFEQARQEHEQRQQEAVTA